MKTTLRHGTALLKKGKQLLPCLFSVRAAPQTMVVQQPFWSSLKMLSSKAEMRRKTLYAEMARNWCSQLAIYAVDGHNIWGTVLLGPWTSEPPRPWAVLYLPPRHLYSLSLCPFTIKARTDRVFSTLGLTLIVGIDWSNSFGELWACSSKCQIPYSLREITSKLLFWTKDNCTLNKVFNRLVE